LVGKFFRRRSSGSLDADVYNFENVSVVVEGKGAGNIIRAMGNHGVRRLVCASSSATDIKAGPPEGSSSTKCCGPSR
jgi:hypothetical protein